MADIKPGKASLMAVNMIVDDSTSLTATSQATGAVSKPQKEGAGAAGAYLTGTYNGAETLDYYIEIEGTGEIGAATFKWSDDGGATFNATGVTTSTAPVALNNGVSVFWTQGAGDDVVIGDNWRFKGYLPYHRSKITDRDRDTEWRSADTAAQTLTFDLGVAQQPKVLVVLDHNLTAGASIRLQGSSNNFGAVAVDYALTYTPGSLLYFLGEPLQTLRYWRLQMTDGSNPDGYLRVSEVFLGDYTRLSRTFSLGDLRGKLRMGQRSQMLSGKYYGAVNTVVHAFDLSWVRLSQTDRDALIAVFDALNDLDNRQVLPVFFSPMSTDLTQVYLCEWSDQQVVATGETDAPERFTVPVRLVEMARTLDTGDT